MPDTRKLSALTKTLIVIAIIGAVNWGLIGFFNFNLVDAIFGGGSAEETSGVSRIVYALVGLAGLIAAFLLPKLRGTEFGHRTARSAM
jgi:uncharacterized membrane protein YuzA (DUF378 family)